LNLELLSTSEIERLHQATICLLENIGVVIEHEGARKKLKIAGCRINGERVQIPAKLLSEVLTQIPGPFTLYGSRSDFQVEIGRDKPGGMTLGGAPNIFDYEKHCSRPSTSKDLADAAKVADWAGNIPIFAALFWQEDVPASLVEIMEYSVMVKNYSKVFNASIYSSAGVHWITRMASTVSGGLDELREKPTLIYSVCPSSPLRYSYEITEALISIAEYGLPLSIVPLPILGISAPITMAGALVQQNAEILAGVILAHQYSPGLPILYNGLISSSNMYKGLANWGAPEVGLAGVCSAQLARFYNLPCKVYGFSTSVETSDTGNLIERTTNATVAAMAKPSLLGGMGSLSNLNSASLEQIIIDNEIMDRNVYYLGGLNIDETRLALDEILTAMEGKSFLEQQHTLDFLRTGELWSSQLYEDRSINRLSNNAYSDFDEKIHSIVTHILENHHIDPIGDDIEQEIDHILLHARKEILN